MLVVGTKKVDFKDSKSGDSICGLTVYVQYPEDNVDGYATDKIFLSRSKFGSLCDEISSGCSIEILYNKYGKVCNVTIK